MSQDYCFFGALPDGRKPTLRDSFPPIGTADEVMARVSALFPSLRWKPPYYEVRAWFGVDGPVQFILVPEADGRVMALKGEQIDRAQALALAAALGLVVFDTEAREFLDT
jgi:hypothetical protein